MKRLFLRAVIPVMGLVVVGSMNACADVLYQDTTTPTGYALSGFVNGQQIGEQIWLGTGALPESLTNFSFEYYSTNTSWSGTVTADIKFYLNNGTPTNGYATPGTLFYDSGALEFPNPITYNGSAVSNALWAVYDLVPDLLSPPGGMALDTNTPLPSSFTFTITFSGFNDGEMVALPIYEPPAVGTNYGDYWFDASGTWELLTNAVPVAFGAEFNGTPAPTPEPSVVCLGAMGGMALAALRRRQKRV